MTKLNDNAKAIRLNIRLAKSMMDQLREISILTGAPISEIVRRAVAEYVKGIKW